jgi:hypothetical protein
MATLESLADRKGGTLVSQLLGAWMGQIIGFSINSRSTSTEESTRGFNPAGVRIDWKTS